MYCFAKSLTLCTDFGAIAAADENYIRTYSSTSRSCCWSWKSNARMGRNKWGWFVLLVAFFSGMKFYNTVAFRLLTAVMKFRNCPLIIPPSISASIHSVTCKKAMGIMFRVVYKQDARMGAITCSYWHSLRDVLPLLVLQCWSVWISEMSPSYLDLINLPEPALALTC